MLKVNDTPPAFSLPDQDGNLHTLEQYKGNWVLIYFYPKDDTPGCTKEACGLRDNHRMLSKGMNAVVLGVSKDPVASHKKFVDKYDLPFALLSDESTEMIQTYGAWKEKSMFGKTYMGINRISYLIHPHGHIAAVFPKVKPAEHAKEVMETIKSLELQDAHAGIFYN